MIILIVFDIATITKLYLYRKVNIYLQIRLKCEVSKWVINTNKQFKKVQNLDCILNQELCWEARESEWVRWWCCDESPSQQVGGWGRVATATTCVAVDLYCYIRWFNLSFQATTACLLYDWTKIRNVCGLNHWS